MNYLADALVILVGLLHCGFLILEMFLWTKPIGLRVFRQSLAQAKASEVLAANQGLYNGFLAAGLFWGVCETSEPTAYQFKIFFLVCVIAAGIYGAFSVSRKILYVQAIPAMIALAAVALFK